MRKKPKTKKYIYYEASNNLWRDFKLKNAELKQMKSEISVFLEKYKKEKKIGNSKLADKIGISEKKLEKILNNSNKFKIKYLLKILFVLGYDASIKIEKLTTVGPKKIKQELVIH